MPDVNEFLPVVNKLLEKTKARKVEWKGTYESATFICTLEGEYSFEIAKLKTASGTWHRRLTMKDKLEDEVFELHAFAPSQNSSMENDQLYDTLDELYEQARRTALDLDKKIKDVSSILDKI